MVKYEMNIGHGEVIIVNLLEEEVDEFLRVCSERNKMFYLSKSKEVYNLEFFLSIVKCEENRDK